MRMNKNNFKPLPPFKTFEEEADFWDEHSFEDYDRIYGSKHGELKPDDGYKWVKTSEPSQMVHIRLPLSLKQEVEKEADRLRISVSATLRMWAAEKLQERKETYNKKASRTV